MGKDWHFREQLIADVYRIEPFISGDERGGVLKEYERDVYLENGIDFIPREELYISSKRSVLRGLHFQNVMWQDKLVRCLSGRVWMAIVDIRKQSNMYGKWISVLPSENELVFIPKGCALGTLALEDSIITLKNDEKYFSEYDTGIRWNDPDLGIEWPLDKLDGEPVISSKDRNLRFFRDCDDIKEIIQA